MVELFKETELDPSLLKALEKEHITTPTDVQRQVIPEVLKGRDLIVQSETGTGKTLAYLLPLFKKVNTEAREMQALVLTPTHELAIQVQHVIEGLVRFSDVKLTSAPMIGNVNIDRQIDKLKQKPHIIVGTPGRVLELIKKKKIAAHTVRTIVLDEADRLLGDSDIDDVRAVIKSTLRDRQMLMFSASVSKEAEARGRELMKEPEVIRGEPGISIPDTIEHLFFLAEQREKFEVLRKVLRILNPQKAVVFTSGIEEAELVTEKLKYHGFHVESLHGTNHKDERKKALEGFRGGKLQLLVASDIASRGLDIEGITHIFSLNAPEDPRDYLHRAGRTGRNGRPGVAVSIVTDRELQWIRHFEKVLNITISAKAMYKGNIIDAKMPLPKSKTVVRTTAPKERAEAARKAKPAPAKEESSVKRLPAVPGRPKFRAKPAGGNAPRRGGTRKDHI
jgi:superfamily II DNA/RNA helicase